MSSVAQILNSEFTRSWHEAVAIVQEAASQLQPGLALPGPDDLEIDEAGALVFGFADESSENPVSALAGLLQRLIEGAEAPQSLQDLVAENAKPGPAHATVSSFSRALAFFERPNRANDVRAVAGRLRTFREKSPADQEFERLREKVAHAPERKKDEEARKKPQLSKRQQVIVASAICLLLLGTFGFRSGLHRSIGTLTGRAETGIQNVVSAGLERVGLSAPASAAPGSEPLEAEGTAGRSGAADRPARTAASSRTAPVRKESTRADVAARSTPPAVVPEIKVSAISPLPTVAAPVEPSAAAAEGTPALAVIPGGGAVYSPANPEVQAPVLIRPQFPKEPAPGDDTGIFDMLIDENGDVAHVKLISPRRRFHDRMLVAAAKAWKFRPASMNGHPVKYRIRIHIILTGMP